ncbi:efflux transporter outer membrane subunit [Variovorax sp. YR216]|uniref:efflux transporter outer membrane subunit n=1 Tax=Variovorax sp. YR216 TaxID=1882828 RepID=UPI00089651A2|nr:efflux transporter outer membrane subunit [Variovorax sp. YR216]SEB25961.1 efflux transporter, outer membrane factor (OMF) lipoprotein, NodT family [Variovorax sp. YR216]
MGSVSLRRVSDAIRRQRTALVFAVPTLWLTACALPEQLPPQVGRLEADAIGLRPELAAPSVDEAWWRVFRDPELDALVEKALADSPSLEIAAARLRRAWAVAARIDAEDRPLVAARFDSVYQRFPEHALYPPSIGGTQQALTTVQLAMSWELDFFGRNRSALAAALGNARAAQADAAMARLLLASQVVRSYVQLSRLLALREVAERALSQRNEVLALVRRRTGAGLDTAVELQQAEGAIPESHQSIEALDEQIAARRHALVALTAQPVGAADALRPRIAQLAPQPLPADVPADLLGRRADIDAARRRAEAAARELDVAHADFYPSVNLVAFAGYNALGLDRLFEGGSRAMGIGPAIRLPILDAGRLRANQRAKAADLDAAIAAYNAALLEAVRDATDQISALQSIDRQQQDQTRAQAFAERAYRLAVARYEAGLSSYLVVLSAENSVLAQRRAAADLQARALDSQAELMRALGGGYIATADDPDGRPRHAGEFHP